jgi:hypothetical protein
VVFRPRVDIRPTCIEATGGTLSMSEATLYGQIKQGCSLEARTSASDLSKQF